MIPFNESASLFKYLFKSLFMFSLHVTMALWSMSDPLDEVHIFNTIGMFIWLGGAGMWLMGIVYDIEYYQASKEYKKEYEQIRDVYAEILQLRKQEAWDISAARNGVATMTYYISADSGSSVISPGRVTYTAHISGT